MPKILKDLLVIGGYAVLSLCLVTAILVVMFAAHTWGEQYPGFFVIITSLVLVILIYAKKFEAKSVLAENAKTLCIGLSLFYLIAAVMQGCQMVSKLASS